MAFGKIAVKRLTDTDLTVFDWHFHNQGAWRSGAGEAKQKAINLDKRPFIQQFFPGLAGEDGWPDGRPHFPVRLSIYGPEGVGPHLVDRTVSLEHKNWRLNGLIAPPEGDPERFNGLRAGDLVVMAFEGEGYPVEATLVFLESGGEEDAALIAAVDPPGGRSTVPISPVALDNAAAAAGVSSAHGIRLLLPSLAEEMADEGAPSFSGTSPFDTPVYMGSASDEALRQARLTSSEIGVRGEEFVNAYLASERTNGEIADFEWVAEDVADSPFDFLVEDEEGWTARVDSKATTGPFENKIHISINEIKAILEDTPYLLYRVYEMDQIEGEAKLRVCADPKGFVEKVVAVLRELPDGVAATSIRLDTAALTWGPEQAVGLP